VKYAAYITRADHWSFESRERVPISRAEWLAYVANDSELQPIVSFPAYDVRTGVKVFDAPAEGHWEWIAYSKKHDKQAGFEYLRGGIVVRGPDAEVLRKAISIARTLGARVIGDDDEVFGETR